MGDKTKIEWTDATWNPVRGCSVVSEGCRNCYAMQVAARFSQRYWEVWQGSTLVCSAKMKLTEAGARNKVENEARNGVVMEARESSEGQAYAGLAYRNSSGAHWTGEVRLIEEHLEDPLRWQRPRKIFVNSMSDLFHESIPDEWIDRIFAVMALANWHTFQILTKRPQRMLEYLSDVTCPYRVWSAALDTAVRFPRATELANRHNPNIKRDGLEPCWPIPNIWLGVSAEDQQTADERIPLLLQTPAAVRWISAEPLLGPIDLTYRGAGTAYRVALDWVVVGGESGPGARPMHPDWVRSIRDQCKAASVPLFFKQWGKYLPLGSVVNGDEVINGTAVFDQDGERLLPDCCGNDYDIEDGQVAVRFGPVGKKAAGNLLDGRQHLEYPA